MTEISMSNVYRCQVVQQGGEEMLEIHSGTQGPLESLIQKWSARTQLNMEEWMNSTGIYQR
jgi:hypothetical protein